jgi:hypothetical protein
MKDTKLHSNVKFKFLKVQHEGYCLYGIQFGTEALVCRTVRSHNVEHLNINIQYTYHFNVTKNWDKLAQLQEQIRKFVETKRKPQCEVYLSSPPSAKSKNAWIYTSSLPYVFIHSIKRRCNSNLLNTRWFKYDRDKL